MPAFGGYTSAIVTADAFTAADGRSYNDIGRTYLPAWSPFLSFTFLRAVAAVEPSVRVAQVMDENGLRFYVPFQTARTLLGAARVGTKIGGHMSDCFSVIGPFNFRHDLRALPRLLGVDAFAFDHYPVANLSDGVGAQDVTVGKTIDISAGPEAYWDEVGKANRTFLKNLIKRKKKLEKDLGEITIRTDVRDHRVLDDLIARKREQYRRTNVFDALGPEWVRRLLHVLLDSRGQDDAAPSLSVMYAGDTFIAGHFGLLGYGDGASTLHYWLPVYDTTYRTYAPGHVFRHVLINEVHKQGVTRLDLGEGENAHKQEYVTADYQLCRDFVRRRSVKGMLCRVQQSLQWRLAPGPLSAPPSVPQPPAHPAGEAAFHGAR